MKEGKECKNGERGGRETDRGMEKGQEMRDRSHEGKMKKVKKKYYHSWKKERSVKTRNQVEKRQTEGWKGTGGKEEREERKGRGEEMIERSYEREKKEKTRGDEGKGYKEKGEKEDRQKGNEREQRKGETR